MSRKSRANALSRNTSFIPSKKEQQTLLDITEHYNDWTDDNDQRRTRKNGWNQITDAYYGKLPEDWPYMSRVVDPRIRTSILEKNARLLNSKLRGRFVPRKGGSVLGANLNNSLIDFQWDNANDGGSMQTKLSIVDQDTRLYQSKFVLVKWKYEEDADGEVIFDGNEMYPLDIRDCGMDFKADHIRNAKWFQHREWVFLEDLERENDFPGAPKYKNLDVIKGRIADSNQTGTPIENSNSSKRENEYVSRVKQLRGLEDRIGTDTAYPTLEVVTEYREDKWITFAPEYNVIIREIDNPYDHGKIPISQNRYYALQDDNLGESEVEAVIPLWKAIQATVCGYMDEVILKQRPPLKILDGEVRIETIVNVPDAQWLMDRPDAVQEMQSNGEAIRFFQITYSALVSAFSTAMGDLSQGTSGVDPFSPDKTATEVRETVRQQSTRDQKNQNDLAEFIKDIISMWVVNNRQFLFADPSKHDYVLRIVGTEQFEYFKRSGLDEMTISDEAMQLVSDIITTQGGNLSDSEMNTLIDTAKTPKHPVILNPNEKDPEKISFKPKMEVSELGDSAELSIVPEDLNGNYDYIADVKSMAIGAGEELARARAKAMDRFVDPTVNQMLLSEGFRPKIKEMLSADLESTGLRDAERFFEAIENEQQQINPNDPQAGGVVPGQPQQGLPGVPQAGPIAGNQQQVAGAI